MMHSMQELMPETYKELCDIREILEKNYHDMLDVEFTIQEGKLYMLQCRVGKRTGVAALTMALDMLHEGLIDEKEVVMRLTPAQLDELLHPILDAADEKKHTVIAKGLPAGPGGAVGVIALDSETSKAYTEKKIKNILVREETNPEDVEGMRSATGILTARGGMTSRACSPRCPRLGQVLHRGLRCRENRHGQPHRHHRRPNLQRGRPAELERLQGLGLCRRGEDD